MPGGPGVCGYAWPTGTGRTFHRCRLTRRHEGKHICDCKAVKI